MFVFVGSLCFLFAAFLKSCRLNLHSLSNHFLVIIDKYYLNLLLITFRFKDLRAALFKTFSIISTAWFIPSWDFGNSYFIKCKTSSWDSVDINALEKGYEDSLSQMYWIGNFFSDRKSIFAPFLKLRFVFCIEPSCNNLTMIWDTSWWFDYKKIYTLK